MNSMAANWKSALAAILLAGTAAGTAWGVTFNLNDGTTAINCAAVGSSTIDASGNITATVQNGCIPSGDPPPAGTFTLTVTKQGTGTGTITGDPPGNGNDDIDCGTNCAAVFDDGTSVTLTASPGVNSTFAGWGGACSGTGSCMVSMTVNRSVTATFNSTGGGGGSDPGAGLWINGSNYVHDRGTLTELYVPRCVPSQYNNCRYGGQQSQYDTMVAGQVWAMRIPTGSNFAATSYPFGVERAETGEVHNAFDFAVSTTPGEFNVASSCKKSGTGQIRLHNPSVYTPGFGTISCPVNPNTTYYLNVRPQAGTPGEQSCGIGSGNACRYRITLPTGFPYQ